MKLLRYGPMGAEKPGVVDDNGEIRDLSGIIGDIDSSALSDQVLQKLRDTDLSKLSIVSEGSRIGACVGNIGKMICIGLNYSDHAAETGATPPPEPIIFMKANSAICGPNDDVRIPKTSEKTDWEVELGFVIGKEAKYVSEAKAMEHVAGYCIVNDVSERSFQAERSGQWTKGKSCDTFGPTGPWMVTRDEIANPQNLKMTLDVNGKRYQDGSTSTMIFGVEFLVHYLSQFFTLYPGDVISTGTPPGVGLGVKPNPVFLKPGDEMRLSIEGLGEQHQKCVAD
ncbi:MAG: fumarylacetoacetate hydrolase family protein [Alphaproteobacteria bacterium]|nr:fumarylacetoacetate hydrolase family protein [Alphaproteobacteria bacterium]MDG1888505.1 fumarylacetoacetate hydrolase family protein [Alphaproteobacteria bacterium]